MQRSDLEHVLRAAGAISAVREWVIVGSQAILGAIPDAPADLLVSQEVDLYAPQSEAASDLIDGSIVNGRRFTTRSATTHMGSDRRRRSCRDGGAAER